MTFEEWWKENCEGSSDGYAVAVNTWNAALEEAAKVADKNATPEKHMAAYLAHQKDAEDIRSLKEE